MAETSGPHRRLLRRLEARRLPARRATPAVVGALALAGCLGIEPGEQPRFDVCRQQIRDFVRDAFEQHVTGIEFYYVYERRDLRRWDYSKAIVSVAECPGYHYFEVRATADMCETQPHYGSQPSYLRHLGAFDGC